MTNLREPEFFNAEETMSAALKRCIDLVLEEPHDLWAHRELIRLFESQNSPYNRWSSSTRFYNEHYSERNFPELNCFVRAYQLFLDSRYGSATREFTRLLDTKLPPSCVHYGLYECNWEDGCFNEALTHLDNAVETQPCHPDAALEHARRMFEWGNFAALEDRVYEFQKISNHTGTLIDIHAKDRIKDYKLSAGILKEAISRFSTQEPDNALRSVWNLLSSHPENRPLIHNVIEMLVLGNRHTIGNIRFEKMDGRFSDLKDEYLNLWRARTDNFESKDGAELLLAEHPLHRAMSASYLLLEGEQPSIPNAMDLVIDVKSFLVWRPEPYVVIARYYFAQKAYEKVLDVYEEFMEIPSDNLPYSSNAEKLSIEIEKLRLLSLYRMNDLEKALSAVKSYSGHEPDGAMSLTHALVYFSSRDTLSAISVLNSVRILDFGFLQEFSNSFSLEMEAMRVELEDDPFAASLLSLYPAYQDDIEKSRKWLQLLAKRFPQSSSVAMFQGHIELIDGNSDKAESYAREALQLDTHDRNALLVLCVALAEQDKGYTLLEQANDCEHPIAPLLYARDVFRRVGTKQEKQSVCEKILALEPSDEGTLWDTIADNLNDFSSILNRVQKYTDDSSLNMELVNIVANHHFDDGEYQSAERQFEILLEHDYRPLRSHVFHILSSIYRDA